VSETQTSPTQPRLLPDRWRRPVGVASALCVLGVAGLGWRYAGGRTADPLDAAIANQLIADGEAHYHLLALLAMLGSPLAMVLGIGILVTAARRAGRNLPAVVLAAAGPVLASLVTEVLLKPLIDRTHEGGLSLPSGHVTSITAQVAVFLVVFVAAGLPRRVWLRRVLVVLGGLATVGVSGAMVSLERHYATDTVAGVLVGACVVGVLALLLDRWTRDLDASTDTRLAGHER
jgi:membrane-associated phospholipid phosphatase